MINKYSSNHLENYIIDFIDRLIDIIGNKIKIKNKNIPFFRFDKNGEYVTDNEKIIKKLCKLFSHEEIKETENNLK